MQCLQCQHHNPEGAKFCNACATPIIPICPWCATENPAGANFCHQCATNLQTLTSVSGSVQFVLQEAELENRFYTMLRAVMWLLLRDKRVTYRELKHVLALDESVVQELREELILKRLAYDEDGKVLVWTGEPSLTTYPVSPVPNPAATTEPTAMPSPAVSEIPSLVSTSAVPPNGGTGSSENSPTESLPNEPIAVPAPARSAPDAERRQLTVMFCDLVGSTDLSGKLDPEDLRDVVRAYQETAAGVIARYEGHIAQYLGDGLLIYFGFPVAHEDDAQRALYTGLGIPEAMATLNTRLEADYGVELAVRIGIHTGPVVVGEMGGGGRHENLALGETPNIAARLEGLAQANTTVISPVTAQLVQRAFIIEALGPHELKGVAEPMMLYRVCSPREAEHDGHAALLAGRFDALVGRDEEIGLLVRRWDQSQEGFGQVVLISGEAGIGKSSLVEGLRDHVRQAGGTRIAFRCSPYHTNSAFYPIIEHIQRALGWQPEDTTDTRLAKLEQALAGTSLPLEEAVPLLAALLSLPLPEGRYAALTLSPQQQRQQTQDVLVAWLLEEAERHPVLAVWEDLHWADPSTLETLGLLVEQVPTATMLHVLTFRPEFVPPWPPRSHLTPLTLNRLERPQVEALVHRLAGGKRLPEEVVAHIVGKTDGVPLYVEELTKMLLASDLLREDAEQYVLTGPLVTVAIPDTLQDSLMARLDQMNTAKEVAQLGSVLGREFAYDMLRALAWQDEETLQTALAQLVQAELLYQRGRPPRAKYIFKHALIQDAAYASLLRSSRQQIHEQIAQLLETHFLQIVESQPELVAHHYTEAGQGRAAIGYWQKAGEHARKRSAHREAIEHLTQALDLLTALPEGRDRTQHELDISLALGPAVIATEGWSASRVEHIYIQARDLCHQLGDAVQLLPVLRGLRMYYAVRGQLQTALQLGEELFEHAQRTDDPVLLTEAHWVMGATLSWWGELSQARTHLEQGLSLYDPQQYRVYAFRHESDPGVLCLCWLSWVLWFLGYPDQARQRSDEVVALSEKVSQPFSQAYVLTSGCWVYEYLAEYPRVQANAEAAMALATEQGFISHLAHSTFIRGWVLAAQGQMEPGLDQMRQGIAAWRATGAELVLTYFLARLAEMYGNAGRVTEGLETLSEALRISTQNGERFYEAELHRLQGTLILTQDSQGRKMEEVEACFLQALEVSRHQQAKSLELRAATSLARLWQSQGKHQSAYDLLAPVYEWFTEGFDTADLMDARSLVDELRPEKGWQNTGDSHHQ
jgi:class 3 adenylate cyclase/predicted ATPase